MMLIVMVQKLILLNVLILVGVNIIVIIMKMLV